MVVRHRVADRRIRMVADVGTTLPQPPDRSLPVRVYPNIDAQHPPIHKNARTVLPWNSVKIPGQEGDQQQQGAGLLFRYNPDTGDRPGCLAQGGAGSPHQTDHWSV